MFGRQSNVTIFATMVHDRTCRVVEGNLSLCEYIAVTLIESSLVYLAFAFLIHQPC